MDFRYKWMNERMGYSGAELRSRWVREQTGLDGDAAAVFQGPCDVPTDRLVDMDDAAAGATIVAAEMAHVIVEHPGCPLPQGVLRQRLLVCILCESLGMRGVSPRREGDDVFVDGRKLTVSIAAPAPDATLIHLGVNVNPAGAPVPAVGLDEIGVRADELLHDVMIRYGDELRSASHAVTKVREVE